MYVLGGHKAGEGTTASVFKHDSAQGIWSEVDAMPEARDTIAACAVGSAIYVFGGHDENFEDRDSVFKYDTVMNTWSILAPMPFASSNHSASVLDGVVYITGAGDDGYDVLRFDPASGTWTTLDHTSSMQNCGASFVLGGCLCVAGGFGEGNTSSVERYDVNTNAWTAVAGMLDGRCDFGAVTILRSAGPAEEQDLFDSLIAKASKKHV
jgi:N-acetylneuraminic acid mutarotase